MCAIAGVIGENQGIHSAGRMLFPGGKVPKEGCYVNQKGILLSDAPAAGPSGEGIRKLQQGGKNRVIAFTGELYNREELSRELDSPGAGDGTLVLLSYLRWGPACLPKLLGMYSFGIWEEESGRLFLARDPMGGKPMFYKEENKCLLFSSEIRSLLRYPGVRAELDQEGAAEILLLGPGKTPGCGVFRGIGEIKPGHWALWDGNTLQICRWWHLEEQEHRDNFAQTAECVRSLVLDSIHRQTRDLESYGTFLSGGLDSSLISAVCAGEKKQRGEKLLTFSVEYADNDRYFVPDSFQPNADGVYVEKMRQALGSEHHTVVLTADALAGALHQAVLARDLPGMADVDASLLLFCREVGRKVPAALSGECADELFGGYPWFREKGVQGFPWAQNVAFRLSLASPELRESLSGSYVQERWADTCRQASPGKNKEQREMILLNQQWFMQTLLARNDCMSRAAGLNVRVPFCDMRLAQYLYCVPWAYKNHGGREKGLLRAAMGDLLPEEVLYRKKSPYPKTADPAYFHIVAQRLQELLKTDAPLFRLTDREKVAGLLNYESEKPWYGQLMRTPQLIAYLLQVQFWLEEYQIHLLF